MSHTSSSSAVSLDHKYLQHSACYIADLVVSSTVRPPLVWSCSLKELKSNLLVVFQTSSGVYVSSVLISSSNRVGFVHSSLVSMGSLSQISVDMV